MDEKIEEKAKDFCEVINKYEEDSFNWWGIYDMESVVKELKAIGYRKESDTAKEICDLILEYWKVDAFVDCSWVIEVISEKYGVDLVE